jgi:hypothetical protein
LLWKSSPHFSIIEERSNSFPPAANAAVGPGNIGFGNLQIEHRLSVGFILGMKERECFGFVLGAKAVLFLGDGVFGVKNPGSLKQDES